MFVLHTDGSISGYALNGTELWSDYTSWWGDYQLLDGWTVGSHNNSTILLTGSWEDVQALDTDVASEDVTVDGPEDKKQWYDQDERIEIDTAPYLEHGESAEYTVRYYTGESGDPAQDITNNSTMSVGDSSVLYLSTGDQTITATSDISINERTYLQAEWESEDNETFTTRYNVTVANLTVDNLKILPAPQRFSASISDSNIMSIILATATGTAIAVLATSFAGLGAYLIFMAIAWFGGFVETGIFISAILIVLFIGLNLANNMELKMGR